MKDNTNLKDIHDNILKLPLKDVSDLCTMLQESLNISPASLAPAAAPAAQAASAEAAEEKSNNVNIKITALEEGVNRVQLIKAIRVILSLNLMEAKKLIDSPMPVTLQENIPREKGEELQKELAALKAKTTIEDA